MGLFGVEIIKTSFWHCREISPVGGAKEAIEALQQVGGEFIRLIDMQPHPNPCAEIDAEGSIRLSQPFRHPAIQPSRHSLAEVRIRGLPPETKPWAEFGFTQECRYVRVFQDASFEDGNPRLVDRLALGQLSLACDLYPLLRPKYGWVDELGFNQPREDDIMAGRLQLLLWANFFGPELVQVLGQEFLAGAPGWRLVDFPDGGMLYVATESYVHWYETDQEELVRYFRQKVPDIQQYRAFTHDGYL